MKLEDLDVPFWFPSGSNRLGASADAIDRAEHALGRRLPEELVKALRVQDGGVSTYSSFRRGDYQVPLPAFFSLEQVLSADANRAVFGTPQGLLAIASGGHDWLGLDYRNSREPSVVYQETEDSDIEFVANTFEELLDGLVED